ncbi:MAG: uroporphyrinogen-III C-methyltransferase [Oscillospiraceae bacterium]|nr:uroporphyrinogen-III C-methyltransferase [Oscillospiraceae bacterium]
MMVYLVGAGPGGTGLITQKGLECIKNADVIIYDHLANPSLLSGAKDGCALIYAGKTVGNHHMNQEKINAELIKYGAEKNVVRLKGGDPFVFGRGGEEADALAENNIPYEIVPGVSSCYSAAEYCGIPVTHRNAASSFHVITGHGKTGKNLDFSTIAKLDGTLVFLMGLSNAANISSQLIKNGMDAQTPSAIISNATAENQKIITGTLKSLPESAKRVSSPAVIIIGGAVELRREWFYPSGKKILATGTKSMNARIRKAAKGTDITEIPIIKTTPQNFELFDKTDLKKYTHIVFTSANGVELFFEFMNKSKRDIRLLCGAKFAAVGEKTAAALEKRGIFTDIIPKNNRGEDLAKTLCAQCQKSDRLLLIRAKNGADTIPKILTDGKIQFTDMPLYSTETDFSKKELLNLCVPDTDYIILSSGSAAKAFSEMAQAYTNAKFISIGAETSKAARKYGIEIYKTAERPTAESIIECILTDKI